MEQYRERLQSVVNGKGRTFCCHSGTLSGRFPPNSLAAVAECAEAGVPRLEVDVRFMADDAMLIFHDGRLESASTGLGVVGQLARNDVASLRYRKDEGHGLCFLEDVVDVLRSTDTLLQVDLKLMRPISKERAAALASALAPLGERVLVGSQAHWNLRRLDALPVAFDPTLQWHYDPERTFEEAWPRTMGIHGLWDDAPLASIPAASARDYVEGRLEDIRGLLPVAREWMVDIRTILHLDALEVSLGAWLAGSGVALAAWTLHADTPERAGVIARLFSLDVETIITDAPIVSAGDVIPDAM